MLAELAVNDATAFAALVKLAKDALPAQGTAAA
jgi:large subunit ribosomal protein L20